MSHGTDSKYFSTTKKGEIHELKQELNSLHKEKKVDAVKKVIAAMTVGKDVSMLFPDVVNCMQTDNLELKKLVYLYLINYAKSQPDLAIMAVNTFVKDTRDPNPLVRALAVRTMGCIRVDKITEYLCDPLQLCLKDDDPYVRKTAAICVAKLYDINGELVEDRGFLETLKEMLSDSNPMVVANSVAALAEIHEQSSKPVFQITSHTLFKLLAALNECTEWGQVFILDSLANYTPKDARDAESIVERVTPRLQHANCAVVLSAVKVILKQMEAMTNQDLVRTLCKKMAPPLVTLLSAEAEIQYVALRNINLIIQRRPSILAHEIKVFFCKYNDPIYVKMEKLEIMIKLASERNIEQVLLEFKEYATEVDVDFVRRSVRAIGRCAINLDKAAERCIQVLLELIETKVNYVVQEAVIVIKDIFRRYPNKYESIISTLCDNLDTLDEPEARASMVWIVGEYAERIDNADELLESFLETFADEATGVQLQVLTAVVKLFLKRPTEKPQRMIQTVLQAATQETDNPDLRDRAYIYWRLLSTDPEAAKNVVLAEKPVISDDASALDASLLDELLANIATLASVYHKPADTFVGRSRPVTQPPEDDVDHSNRGDDGGEGEMMSSSAGFDTSGDLLGGGDDGAAPAYKPGAPSPGGAGSDLLGDLLGLDIGGGAPAPVAAPFGGDILGDSSGGFGFGAPAAGPPLPVLLPAAKGSGLQISGKVIREGGRVLYHLVFDNISAGVPLDGFMIQLNKNAFGLTPTGPLTVGVVAPGGSGSCKLPLSTDGQIAPGPAPSTVLQVAIKNNQQPVWYFTDNLSVSALFGEDGALERSAFLDMWKSIPDTNERRREFQSITIRNADATSDKLARNNVFFIAKRTLKENNADVLYHSIRLPRNIIILCEITSVAGYPGTKVSIKSASPEYSDVVFTALESLLAA